MKQLIAFPLIAFILSCRPQRLDPSHLPDFNTARPYEAPLWPAQPYYLFMQTLIPREFRNDTVAVAHYWRQDDKILLLSRKRLTYRKNRPIPIDRSGEHWFVVAGRFDVCVHRVYYDQPGLVEWRTIWRESVQSDDVAKRKER